MKALVVGYGSIGRRHARLLDELGCSTAVVSRSSEYPRHYGTLEQALAEWQPDYAVIANETARHHETFVALAEAGFSGRVLIEKPLFDVPCALSATAFAHAAVAYNFRCHPLIIDLAQRLAGRRAISADFRVGQWLPEWRPGADYRNSSSARRTSGGGTLLDLSHEIDLALMLLGSWRRLTARSGHFSGLEIDTDDASALLLETENCPLLTIRLDYLSRPLKREIVVHAGTDTFHADLAAGTLSVNGKSAARYVVERDHSYREQHRAMLDGRLESLCSLEQGMAVLDVIAAARTASEGHLWIEREGTR